MVLRLAKEGKTQIGSLPVVRYCIQPGGTDGPVTPLVRCPEFEQRLLRFDGAGDERRDDARDEVLYVLEGSGTARVGGETHPLEPGTGAFVARRTPWKVEAAEGLLLLSVLARERERAGTVLPREDIRVNEAAVAAALAALDEPARAAVRAEARRTSLDAIVGRILAET